MEKSRPPLYQQVAERISADVERDGLRPGDRLPSERVLCQRVGVSRMTLRAALGLLVERGLVVSSAARGWFVASDSAPEVASPVLGFSELAAAQGLRVSSRVLTANIRGADLDEAEVFRIAPGAALFELRRVRHLDDLAIAVDHSRVPAALVPGVEAVDFTSASLYAVLRAAPAPVLPVSADYSVEAVPADPEDVVLLDVPDGVPLLVATQRTYDRDERPFELGSTRYRGDRYRFRAHIGATRRMTSEDRERIDG